MLEILGEEFNLTYTLILVGLVVAAYYYLFRPPPPPTPIIVPVAKTTLSPKIVAKKAPEVIPENTVCGFYLVFALINSDFIESKNKNIIWYSNRNCRGLLSHSSKRGQKIPHICSSC